MKVEAVSNLGFKSNNFSFGEKQRVHDNVPVESSNSASDLAKVPVIVLLAMNPATLNSKIPTMPETDNPNKITILAPETKSSYAATYVIAPEVENLQQISAPYGWPYLGTPGINIQQVVKGKSPFSSYNLIYTRFSQSDKANDVRDVYLISDGEKKSTNKFVHPPEILKLVYHNLGDDKEYCGAVVKQFYIDKTGDADGSLIREIRMDRISAQSLINLITGHTKWNYKGPIEIEETTNPNTIY